ncbi:MAG: DUF916 domain-containing protein [Candidatus Limiplasma sp.]|nr:DUF916 domain-containing protein [Candidatus Limiplasma sp.]
MKKIVVYLLLMCVLLGLPLFCGYAEENQGYQFSVDIIAPANQIDQKGYYHIPGKPGEQITLQAQLTNQTDHSLDVKMVPMNAYSSQTGIFYQNPSEVNVQKYPLLDDRYGLTSYMTVPDVITLTPKQTQTVQFSVAVPQLREGTLLGCIRFVAFAGTQDLQKSSDQNGTQLLIDKYQAIDIAVQIDLPYAVLPALSVGDPVFDGDKTGVCIQIMNTAALLQKNITGTYAILDQQNTVVFSGDMQTLKMAPLSAFQYVIPWQGSTLEAAKYKLSLTFHKDDLDFSFDRPFTINSSGVIIAKQAQQQNSPEIKTSHQNWYEVAFELSILLLIFLFIRHLKLRGKPKSGSQPF